jgi:hypothetical protein
VVAGPLAKVDQLVDDRLDAEAFGMVAGSSSPALATAWSSSNTATMVLGLWEDGIEKVPSWSGPMDVSATPFSLLRGPFS